ncbi:MAG: rod shape-determining protein MreC [Clostridium sp.]|nr:rod shape-determining protein MreC [Clostridium sp.]
MKNSKYLLAGLSAFCLVLIAVTSINSSFLAPLRTGVGFLLVPLQSGVNAVGTSLYNNIRSYSSLKEAQTENDQLTKRIEQLVEENNRLQSDLYELERLRSLFELDQEYMQYEKVAARVIARDSGNWFQVFRIDKGSSDGIKEDMNVMAGGGLVGIVTDVGANYATVRSIIDDDSNVSGMSMRTGDTCNVSGNLTLYQEGRLGLDHIKKEADIQEGDKIVTSNISDVYLPGILIGYASDLTIDANNVTKSGTILPVAEFDNLQEVLVITQLKHEEAENAENTD